MVPHRQGILEGCRIAGLRGQTVFKGQYIKPRSLGQLGGQDLGIAQVAAGVAAAMAVENGVLFLVGPLQTGPGGGNGTDLKGFPDHAGHGGGQIAQDLLAPALLFEVLFVEDLRQTGRVEGLQHPHGRVQSGFGFVRSRGFKISHSSFLLMVIISFHPLYQSRLRPTRMILRFWLHGRDWGGKIKGEFREVNQLEEKNTLV